MSQNQYWPVDGQTKEVSKTAIKARIAGGIAHIPRTALKIKPVQPKEGFAVVATFDDKGFAIGSEYIEDHRDSIIYDESDCTKSESISELGPVKEGYTLDKPITAFDKRINGAWVTDESAKYIFEYDQVDSIRRELYSQMSDPLRLEALVKKEEGKVQEAAEYIQQAQAARQKIQAENPWPEPPTD
ncbi:hypothetical protein [Vibrio sp. T11.5]|uniref:hypothetical protein n=1 Tax=Vibrio sp. T11.5 TaxID=2998836 RepID=UPI0022CD720D|nr:hypothetical protein [Vibrio sp. T11.5]MDA0118539.1 hypothetical protein [Vibrio sp. T11.5]